MKKTVFWLIIVFIIYAVIEVSSLLVLFIFKKAYGVVYTPTLTSSLSSWHRQNLIRLLANKTEYWIYSPTLGWAIKENGLRGIYRANSRGIRADREYKYVPHQNIIRISCFGDSFTHSSEVRNEDTWEEKINMSIDKLEVINFGVGGFGLDQAFLRYQQDGVRYNSHIIFIGFIPGLIGRDVNVFPPFMTPTTGLPLTKPRFIIKNDRLVLIKNPINELTQYKNLLDNPEVYLPKLGVNDYYFQSLTRYKAGALDFFPSVRLFKMSSCKIVKYIDSSYISRNGRYNEDSKAFKLTTKLFDKFIDSVVYNNALPMIILFPTRADIIQYRKKSTTSYELVKNYLETKGYPYIDIINAFDIYAKELALNDLFMPRNHYSPLANEIVAKYILGYLEEKELTDLSTVKHRLQKMKSQIFMENARNTPPLSGR